jgi:glycosyltransferase involved in cell wall biosynthesis
VTISDESESPPGSARIAVAIPCFNEAAAIATVVAQFRSTLPMAEIVVFDNNSTDGTGAIARGLGVRVADVPEQGKGHAVRAAFADLGDFDVIFPCYDKIVIEVKAVTELCDEHRAQIFNDLKATGMRLGILVNFGAHPNLEHHRIVL